MNFILSVVVAVFAAIHPAPPTSSGTLNVTFVVTDSFAHNPTLTAVVRRGPKYGSELIVVRSNALTPGLVFAAIKSLSESVQRHGQTPKDRVTVYFTTERRFPPLTAEQTSLASRIIDELGRARVRAVAGMDGQHPAVEFPIDPLP